jgi:hypothetical protein
MPYDTLSLEGINVDSVNWRGDVLRANYGNGYGDSVLVGNAAGLHMWELSDGGVSPDRTTGDASGSEIDSVSRFEYYWEFFKDHTTGTTEIFILEWRNKFWHASFAEPEIGAEQMTYDLFTISGVKVRQRRVVGFTYNTDGSIDLNPPSVPVLTTLTVLGTHSIKIDWLASTDLPGDVYTLAGYEVLIDGTSTFDVGNVLTYTYAGFGPGSGHGFQVRSYDSSPTPNYSDWSNSLSGTTTSPTTIVMVDADGDVMVDADGEAITVFV